MNAENNEVENFSIRKNSIRLKYKGGHQGKKLNYDEKKSSNKETFSQLEQNSIVQTKKIIKNEESIINRSLVISSKDITSKLIETKIEDKYDEGINSSKGNTKTKNKIYHSKKPNNNSIKNSNLSEDKGVNYSQKISEISTSSNMKDENIISKNVGTKSRQINDESNIEKKISISKTKDGTIIQRNGNKGNEIIITSNSNERKNKRGKEEIITKIINTTFNEKTNCEGQRRSAPKGKITSIKNASSNSITEKGRQTSTRKNQNQNQKNEEINLIEGLTAKDIKGLRKEIIDQFFSFPEQSNTKQRQIQGKKEINLIKNQNFKNIGDSKKETHKKLNSYQGQIGGNQILMEENKEIELIEGLNTRDVKGLRMEMIKEFYSYQGQNRSHSQGKNQNPTMKLKNEINTIAKTHSRGRSQEQKLKTKNHIYLSQRTNSRRESQNSKNQVNHIITTNLVNRRNSGNTAKTASVKTLVRTSHGNSSNKGLKINKVDQIGLSNSYEKQIKIKEIDHNNRSINKRESSSNKKTDDKFEKTKKSERNLIQVQKVLVTDTAILHKKINNKKSTPLYKTTNNYNSNTYIHKNINNNIATKLAIKEIKSKDQKTYYSTQTNFYQKRDNISSITINESKKTPKKDYELHVRKCDIIRSKSRMRLAYTNNMEENGPVKNDSNHKLLVIKNVTRNFRTISDLSDGEKISHRYSYSSLTSNIGRKEINRNTINQLKKVNVSPRKNEVIKSSKKPFKLNYKEYLDDNSYTQKKNKINSKKVENVSFSSNKNNINNKKEKKNIKERINIIISKTNRNSKNNNESTSQKVLNINFENEKIISNEKKIKIRRNISNLDFEDIKGYNDTASSFNKTEFSNVMKKERNNNLHIGKADRTNLEHSQINYKMNTSQRLRGSSNNKNYKIENTRNQNNHEERRYIRNAGNENDCSSSKIIKVKKTLEINSHNKKNYRDNSIERKKNIGITYKSKRKTNTENNLKQ